MEYTTGMARNEYNAKVQGMQEFCLAAGLQHRVRPNESLSQSRFQVFYDGWQTVGYEINPMTKDCFRVFDDTMDARIRYQVAGDIAS